MLQDVRFALRMLGKHPSFTLVAVLTLAVGIGANASIFSVVNSVLLRPLPFPEPGRLVQLNTQFPGMGFERFWVSPPELVDFEREMRSYSSIGAWAPGGAAVSGGAGEPVRAPAAYVTPGFLPTLGVPPALGRWFHREEDTPGEPKVVLLGHGLWTRAFGADPGIIGRTIQVDAIPVQVVGVMPEGFDFPGDGVELYVPLGLEPDFKGRGSHFLSVIGRLAPGVTLAQARGEIARLQAAWAERYQGQHPIDGKSHALVANELKEELIKHVRGPLFLLQGGVFFVLLIACANLSNLLLARAEARRREVAIRAALGAGQRRLFRMLLTESLLLAVIGGAVGVLIAVWGLELLGRLAPGGMPPSAAIAMDGPVLAFTLALSVGSGLLFGLAPMVQARVRNLHATLSSGKRSSDARDRQRFRRSLVIVQVALAVVLVIASGLMAQSFLRLLRVDPGFAPEGLVTMQLELVERTHKGNDAVVAFWDRLSERLEGLPGVRGVTWMTGLPPNRRVNANDLELEGKPSKDGPTWNVDYWNTVGDDYFRTLGIRLVEGRFFEDADRAGAPEVVIVNQSMARRFWPGESPLGKRVKLRPGKPKSTWQTVVGVVGDVKQQGLGSPTGTEVYIPMRQSTTYGPMSTPRLWNLVVRADGEPTALVSAIRAEAAGLDPGMPIFKVRTMTEVLHESVERPRFMALMLGIFSAVALGLAALGIYGVMSYAVARRTHELGIRLALGAEVRAVLGLVLGQGLALAAVGVAAGLCGTVALNAALGRLLDAMLYDVGAFDARTFGGVAVLVVAVAALASYFPARRATRVDPAVALRYE